MMVHGAPSVEESQETGANVGDARLSTTQQTEKATLFECGQSSTEPVESFITGYAVAHTSMITKLG